MLPYIHASGYIGLTLIYLNYAQEESNHNKLLLIGALFITLGYAVSSFEKIKSLDKSKSKSKVEVEYIDKISLGHTILFSFYLSSFILSKLFNIDINHHLKMTDITALVGHFILITKNKYNKIGYLLLTIYYVLYVFSNIHHDKIQSLLGVILLSYYVQSTITKEKLN